MSGPPTLRTGVVQSAVQDALKFIAKLPDSPEVQALRERALTYERQVGAWTEKPPTPEEREAMMRLVLALHMAATKLRKP